jgi:regulator of replication initiation timing
MNTANQTAQTIKSRADIAASLAKLEAENIQLREENERLRLVIDTIPTTPWLSFKASA